MKKINTAAAREMGKIEGQRLTIGLALGDRSSWYCVLDGAGQVLLEEKLGTTPKSHERGVWGNDAKSDGAGKGDAFA
jgi:hypothetical protein